MKEVDFDRSWTRSSKIHAFTKPYLVWAFLGSIAAIGILIVWPVTPPDPEFTLQTYFDAWDEESVTGHRSDKLDTIEDWHRELDDFGSNCKLAVVFGMVLGLSVAKLVSLLAGWAHLRRRLWIAWLGSVLGGEVVFWCLPQQPPDPVWGHALQSEMALYVSLLLPLIPTMIGLIFWGVYSLKRNLLVKLCNAKGASGLGLLQLNENTLLSTRCDNSEKLSHSTNQ